MKFNNCFYRYLSAFGVLSILSGVAATDIPQVEGLKPIFAEVGESVGFYIEPFGVEPFSYQWFKDGSPIEGEEGKDLVFDSLSLGDEGGYKVSVSNAFGATESNEALLTIMDGVSGALDLEGIQWQYGGTHPFIMEEGEDFVGGSGLVSYPSSDFEMVDAVLEATVAGPGTFVMNLRQESRDGFREPLVVIVDGNIVSRFWPSDDWDEYGVWLGEGDHKVSLSYDTVFYGERSALAPRSRPPTHGVTTWLDDFSLRAKPYLWEQPESVFGSYGETHKISVGAWGDGEISYQWYKDGFRIEGATAPSLEFNSFTEADDGKYHVVIENIAGETKSASAQLSGGEDWRLQVADEHLAPLLSQSGFWVLEQYELNGSGFALTNEDGESLLELTISGPVNIVFDWKIEQLESVEALSLLVDGGIEWRSSYANGSQSGVYKPHWQEGVVRIPEGEHTVVWRFDRDTSNPSLNPKAFLKNLRMSESPKVVNQPCDVEILEGGDAYFGVYVLGEEPLTYQWFKNGELLLGEENDGLSVEKTKLDDSGSYTCLVNDASGRSTLSNSATLTAAPGFANEKGNIEVRVSGNIASEFGDLIYKDGILEVRDSARCYYQLNGPAATTVQVRMKVDGVDGDPVEIWSSGVKYKIGNSNWVDIELPVSIALDSLNDVDVFEHQIGFYIPHWKSNYVYWDYARPMNRNARILIESISVDDVPFVSKVSGSVDAPIGSPINLSATVSAVGAFVYAWEKEGVPVALETSGSGPSEIIFSPGSVSLETIGEYRIRVSNASGEVLSLPLRVDLSSSMGESIGVADWRLSTVGERLWKIDDSSRSDGVVSVSVDNLTPGKFSSLFLEVRGPGVLSYQVKTIADSTNSMDRGRHVIYVDDVYFDDYDEGGDRWLENEISLGMGDHVVEWRVGYLGSDRIKTLLSSFRFDSANSESFGEWAFRELPFSAFALFDNVEEMRSGDQDGDSLPNFVEYLLGSDPVAFNLGPDLSIQTYDDQWKVSARLPWRKEALDVDIGLEISYDLENWFPVAANQTYTGYSDGDWLSLEFSSHESSIARPSFARIRFYDFDRTN